MEGDLRQPGYMIGPASMGQLMPMYLWLGADCCIRGAGPTLLKLLGEDVLGRPLEAVFALRHGQGKTDCAALVRTHGLRLTLHQAPHTSFKGVAVPLQGEAGVLLNLSFGVGIREAVRDHALSASDFAGTDLAIELLYLHEAKTAVMGELTRMAERLQIARSRAEAQALTDPLTGLGNRRAMEGALMRLLHADQPFALVHIDLDYFKQVNDTLGHAAGDHVLAEIAAILRGSVRSGDLVARVGGDEFVMLLPGVTDSETLRRIGAAIYDHMRAPITFEGETCHVALSMGAVLAPRGLGPGEVPIPDPLAAAPTGDPGTEGPEAGDHGAGRPGAESVTAGAGGQNAGSETADGPDSTDPEAAGPESGGPELQRPASKTETDSAGSPGLGTGALALLAQADRALYFSKGAGRGRMTLWSDAQGARELIAGVPVRVAERRLGS